ncbi:MAG: GGDEF domain-containing protein [Xanthomonadales bacterium]|nr:GGDEF domain-containing protein [Xanthomonadales bacterium]
MAFRAPLPDSDASRPGGKSASLLGRLQQEFDLAILTVFGGISAIAVAGFAVYRFLTGSIIGGVVDCGITLGLGAVVVYGWRGNNVGRAGAIFVGFAVMACLASAFVFGGTSTYWAFLVLSISFVVTGVRIALVANIVLIVAIAAQPALFSNLPERMIFAVTALLVTAYGWIFKSRYDTQRRALEAMATQDPLTHAGNRRIMNQHLANAVQARNSPGRTPAVLAVLDLDRFKQVNDTLGHEAGDRVLVRLAEIVRERLRRSDGLYRLGGEEFVVLLNDTTLTEARPVLDDLHRLFGEAMQGTATPVTVSIGAAALWDDEEWEHWLRRADEAMYRAKQLGRDRVEVDEEREPEARSGDRRG